MCESLLCWCEQLDEKVGASLEASLEGRLAAVETDLHAVVDQKVSDKVRF